MGQDRGAGSYILCRRRQARILAADLKDEGRALRFLIRDGDTKDLRKRDALGGLIPEYEVAA